MYRSLYLAAASRASVVYWTLWWLSYLGATAVRMSRVWSTVGSLTRMGWRRRSRAPSFSMCLRYSAMVVAPISCNCPRARAGFIMLAASMDSPSALPAPTNVWTSSTNKMVGGAFWSVTSAMTPCNRSSNSPRYLVPATRLAISNATMRYPRKRGGQRLSSTRIWARPSAMAVLPTPGSPMRQGLFLRRRMSVRRQDRISSSRP